MLDEPSGSDVHTVVASSLGNLTVPLQRTNHLLVLEKLDRFLNCLNALLGPERDLPISLEQEPVKLVELPLQLLDVGLRVLPHLVMLLKNSLVDLANVTSWQGFHSCHFLDL